MKVFPKPKQRIRDYVILQNYADGQGLKPTGGSVHVTFAVGQIPEGVSKDVELMMLVDGSVLRCESHFRYGKFKLKN